MGGILLPGNLICTAEGYIRGHGTNIQDNEITSALYGRVQHINKLVTVNPCFSFKYSPEIGDVVIGRVVQIFNKKWRINTNSKVETTLALSAINLPGVMQRRKLESDEMSMRTFFDINDLIVCEVQKVSKSGAGALHTRNDKYRKLDCGVLLNMPQFLLLPLKTRFLKKENVEIIVGCNGFIWIFTESDEPEDFMKVGLVYKTLKALGEACNQIDVEKVINELV